MNHDIRDDLEQDTLEEDTQAEGNHPSANTPADEAEILRTEMMRLQAELNDAKRDADEFKNKYLRARADLDNYRRRTGGDIERAREAGLNSAIHSVLPVYDDLGRALEVAGADPSRIIPGVEAVRENLKRNLESLGIHEIGVRGERFDPEIHEALSSMPTENPEQAGTIAQVFQVGFAKSIHSEKPELVRPARVVVFQE